MYRNEVNQILIDHIIKKYADIFDPVSEGSALSSVVKHVFRHEKFNNFLNKRVQELYMIWVDENAQLLLSHEFLNNEEFFVRSITWEAPIWDFRFGIIICDNMENVNLIRLIADKDEIAVIDLTPTLSSIYDLIGNNNV